MQLFTAQNPTGHICRTGCGCQRSSASPDAEAVRAMTENSLDSEIRRRRGFPPSPGEAQDVVACMTPPSLDEAIAKRRAGAR